MQTKTNDANSLCEGSDEHSSVVRRGMTTTDRPTDWLAPSFEKNGSYVEQRIACDDDGGT